MARKNKNNMAPEATPPDEENPEKRAGEMVLEHKEDSLSFYDEKFKKFTYFDRLYVRGAAKSNTPYGRANLELPLAFQQIEPFVSQITETMVGETPYISYEGRTPDDDAPAKAITEFTQYQLDSGEFLTPFTQFIRNLGKYGTAVKKVVWEVESKEIEEEKKEIGVVIGPDGLPLIDPITGQPVVEERSFVETKEVVTKDGPSFYNLSIYDFFVPKSASSCDVQKLDWCIHRTWRTLDELIDNPNYKNKKHLRALRDNEDDAYDSKATPTPGMNDSSKETEQRLNNGKGLEKFAGKIEVLEWWGDYRFKKDEPARPALITVAICDGDPVVLRLEDNPLKYKFKPFIAANDYPIEGEFYGYGELDHIKGLIQESTALRNARLDVSNMSLNRMWIVERQAGINLRDIHSAPNKIILTNDNNGIRALDMGNATASSVEEISRIDGDIQNTTEIVNPRPGVTGAAFSGTATGVNFLSAKSNLRLLLKCRILEQMFFKKLAIMLNEYNKQMIDDKVYYRVAGEEQNPYSAIDPQAFSSEIDFKPSSNPSKLSNEEKKANIGYLMQTAAQIEKVAPGTNNFTELLPDIYKLAGFSHADKYVNPPQMTVIATPDGQLLDKQGKPVQVVQVDETGQPIQQLAGIAGTGGQVGTPVQ